MTHDTTTIDEAELAELFPPAQIVQLETGRALPTLRLDPAGGAKQLYALVFLFDHPVGKLTLPVGEDGRSDPDRYAAAVWEHCGEAISARLNDLGLEAVRALPMGGIHPERFDAITQQQDTPGSDPPMVSVVICTYNRHDELREALPGLLRFDYPNYEVIIVENGETGDTTRRLIEEENRGVENLRYCFETMPNLSNARNAGAQQARGEIVVFSDDDVRMPRQWLQRMAQPMAEDPAVALVSGPILPADLSHPAQVAFEERETVGGGFFRRSVSLESIRQEGSGHPYFRSLFYVFGSGGNFAVRRSAYLEVGGCSVRLGSGTPARGGEDFDLFYRLANSGYTCVTAPGAFVYHRHLASIEEVVRRFYWYNLGWGCYILNALTFRPARLPIIVMAGVKRAFERLSGKTSQQSERPANNDLRKLALTRRLEAAAARARRDAPLAYLKSLWAFRAVRKRW